MSQHDMDVANGAGVVVRADINAALQALASSSSGSSAPSPSFPCQLWADTGTSRLKRRNLANSAWLDEGPLDAALRDAASQGEFISDTGAANAYVCNFVPALTVRSESTPLRFKVANANTTASTINDGIGTVSLVGAAHAALQGGELIANGIAWIQWNTSVGGGSYVLLFCTGAPQQVADATKSKHAVTAGQVVQQTLTAFTTGGVSGELTLTPSPAISAYAAPLRYSIKFSQNSTGSDTINISGAGAKSLKQYSSTGAKVAAVFAANQYSDIVYDGTDWVLMDALPVTATQRRQGLRGAATNWKASANGISANIVCSADSVVLANTAGDPTAVDSIALTLNTAAAASAAVDGMASGAVAANTWYGIYVWTNSTTGVKRLTGDTAYTTGLPPTPPAPGFDLWARRSAFLTDASSLPLGFTQNGDSYTDKVATGSNVTQLFVLGTGVVGSPTTPTFVAIPVRGGRAGPSAKSVIITTQISNGGIIIVAPNNNYAGVNGPFTDNRSPSGGAGQATTFLVSLQSEILLEGPNIYWASQLAANGIRFVGWRDAL